MSLILPPNSVLFDKGVIRRVYERRVRLAANNTPTLFQIEAANVYSRLSQFTNRLHITEQTANILQRRTPQFALPLLAEVEPLKKARYLRRWARRLRDFGFSPEDAIVLAYGSFGFSARTTDIGVEVIITADLKLATRFLEQHAALNNRFGEMIGSLTQEYASLKLPHLLTTAQALSHLNQL